jgi:hypothetical protein
MAKILITDGVGFEVATSTFEEGLKKIVTYFKESEQAV